MATFSPRSAAALLTNQVFAPSIVGLSMASKNFGSSAVNSSRVVTRDEFTAELPKFFDAMDKPTIDGANTWFVSKAAAERGLKVAISGLGGDELFGSYPSFRALPRIVAGARIPFAASTASRLARNPKAKA